MSPIICLMGPTASGKTAFSLQLANEFPCEIISVDSAMVYQGMNIGTAKPTTQQQQGIPHYLLDIVDPNEPYSAARFQTDALAIIHSIIERGKIPLLVGGTMLYFKVLQQGLSPLPAGDEVIRTQLVEQANKVGWSEMHSRLAKVDAESAARINVNDSQRIQRALEVYEITQTPLSQLWQTMHYSLPFECLNIVLTPHDRAILHERIAERFEQMLAEGFIEEVEGLRKRGDLHLDLPSMRAVGYRQVWQYLDNVINYQELLTTGIAATRQLAKRQLTWLRHWNSVRWFDSADPSSFSRLLSYLMHTLKGTSRN